MVRKEGYRFQGTGYRAAGTATWRKLAGILLLLFPALCNLSPAFTQQPQTPDAPVFAANAKYVQGVGPGFWPTAGTGLTLNIAAGTAYCGHPPTLVTYAGGTLTLAASATNYAYLNPAANCAPASNTTGFAAGQIPLAKVVTGSSSITSVTEARNWFVPQPIGTDSAGRAVTKHLNGMRFADQFSGANPTAKIDAALADSGSGPGVLVAAPPLGFGSPTNWRNDVAFLDFRQTYDPIDTVTSDPDRVALVLLENRLGDLTTVPLAGTVTLTNGSTAVTGVGTQFLTQLVGLGRSVKLNADSSSSWASVASITSDTSATLSSAYTGTGGAGPASHFRTELGLVVNTQVTGGTPNTGGGGEAVSVTGIAWRTGGTRGTWGGNFNMGYYTRDPIAAAVGLEIDITNDSGSDPVAGTHIEQALRILSAGPRRIAEGIYLGRLISGGEFERAISINNSYSSQGVRVQGPSNHLYLIPNADNNSLMVVGRNAADSATKWSIGNDGAANFSNTIYGGPATSSFSSSISRDTIATAVHAVGTVNPTTKAYALLGTHEDNSLGVQVGVAGLGVGRNTSGAKPLVEGVEGQAYHDAAGTVTLLAGVSGYASMSGASGTVTKMTSLYAYPNDKSAGTVTNNYGLYVDAQTAGTSNYSVFTAGTAPAQFGGAVISGMNTVSFSSTPTFDAKLGNTQKITLTGNVSSSTLSNATAGEQINFLICQDATGNRTFTWPSNLKGGMTIGATASKCSAQTFIFDGTNAYGLSTGVTNM